MIFVNNKLVNFEAPDGEFRGLASEYKKGVAELKERFGKYITVQTRKRPHVNATGLLEPVAPCTIPLHITTIGSTGREEWLYCDSIPEVKDGIVFPETRQKIVMHGELMIDLDTDPDFAYFFLYKHGMIKSGKFTVLDEEKNEKDKATIRKKETILTNAIYGENSQLNIDLTQLRLIAKRWGIANADSQGKETLQNQLYDIVSGAEKLKKSEREGRGIDAFLKDIRPDDGTGSLQVASTVRDAIDQEVLFFDTVNSKWVLNYKDGSTKTIASVSIADRSQKEEVLILYMQSDNNMYALLLSALGKSELDVKDNVDEEAVRTTEEISILRDYARSLGIKIFQMGKEPLRQAILDKLKESKKE